jgi:hypothetical protein
VRWLRVGLGAFGVVVLVVVFIGFLRLLDPPKPTEALRPEIRGVVVAQDFWNGRNGRYTLDTGDVVELNADEDPDLPETPRLSAREIYFEDDTPTRRNPSSLLLVGHDGRGRTWYAAANQIGQEECPFEIYGKRVYDEGDHLLFGTGLVLPESAAFELLPAWAVEREDMDVGFPLGAADQICIDRDGNALKATIWMDY